MISDNEQRNNRTTKIFYKDLFVKYPFENGLSNIPPAAGLPVSTGLYKT